ncbi:hypothetical protein HPB48_002054 [Haemaphysalis longicornis]|uniref:Uncharacterized protein n=1 Tax=Haemaphysalis longicornis TaxID=44386 RepID=A0A9J6FJJ1_HAELO|nr:hypothetical protein HPB48_002054 [Haemaphysalis longicornis]
MKFIPPPPPSKLDTLATITSPVPLTTILPLPLSFYAHLRSSSFDALKVETLGQLDEGFDSLKFLQRLGEAQMVESHFSALMQVCNDYLWTKTAIERAFRKYPQSSPSSKDKKMFRDVLIRLYKYVTKSIILFLTQVGIRSPQNAAQEVGNVLELLLKSVQRIADHQCLQASRFAVIDVRRLGAKPKGNDDEFIAVVKAMRKELSQRKNAIKASSWLSLSALQR